MQLRSVKVSTRGLLRLCRGSWGGIVLNFVVMLLEVALGLAFVWFSKRVVDIATGARAAELMPSVAGLVLVMAGQVACRIASRYIEGLITINTKNRIRASVFSRAMRSTWQGQEKFHSADIVNRLEEDIRVICDFLCSTMPAFFVICAQLIAACVFLFALNPELAWILVFIMPVAVVGSRLFFRKQRELTTRIRGIDGRIQGHMQEHLQHRVVDMTMGSTGAVEEGLSDLQGGERSTTVTRLRYSALSRGFMQVGFAGGYLLAFLWGVFGLRDGTVTYGLMVAFLQLVGQVQRPVAEIASCIPAFIRAVASQERLQDLLEMEQEDGGPDVLLEGAPGLRLSGVSFAYSSDAPVLDSVDFDFAPGSFTAIVGPTGVGKSTLIRLVLALVKPSGGALELYSGAKTAGVSSSTRCNFMYVPQGNTLLSGTIRDNLLLADPSASEEDLKKALHIAAADFVEDLPRKLDTTLAEIGGGLSEGQAQRISIARALLRPGGVLVLDEATSALDEATERTVLENIRDSYKGTKTVLCITHRPAAQELSDATLRLGK